MLLPCLCDSSSLVANFEEVFIQFICLSTGLDCVAPVHLVATLSKSLFSLLACICYLLTGH